MQPSGIHHAFAMRTHLPCMTNAMRCRFAWLVPRSCGVSAMVIVGSVPTHRAEMVKQPL